MYTKASSIIIEFTIFLLQLAPSRSCVDGGFLRRKDRSMIGVLLPKLVAHITFQVSLPIVDVRMFRCGSCFQPKFVCIARYSSHLVPLFDWFPRVMLCHTSKQGNEFLSPAYDICHVSQCCGSDSTHRHLQHLDFHVSVYLCTNQSPNILE